MPFFMDAVVVDLKDFAVRTPEQVIRVFFKIYDAATVQAELWQLFGKWAKGRENAGLLTDGEDTQVALLFDQLIALVAALENLQHGMTEATNCVVCGSQIPGRAGEDPTGKA